MARRRRLAGALQLALLNAARVVLAGIGLRRSCDSLEVALTRRCRLFDRDFYREHSPELPAGALPLRHYVEHGHARALWPSPLFDPAHYAAQVKGRLRVNGLLHYALRGQFIGLTPSAWFDTQYYLQRNPDVARAGLDPLWHFLHTGWREGRSPLPGFDLRRFSNQARELSVSKSNPVLQYLRENLQRNEDGTASAPPPWMLSQPQHPVDYLTEAPWQGIEPRPRGGTPAVDVIMPVYGGTQETLHCLWSVLRAPVRTPYELVLVYDCGPEPELGEQLRLLAARGLFTLLENRRNLGFVKTVNLGLALHPERDAVILNADTEVHNDWLDRLLAHAQADASIATITPLSNNATICSYPETLQNNWMPLEVDAAALDALAAQANPGQHVDAPTGVGFCMYMRRRCVVQVGALDEKHFGRGYGEENDFCQRALRAGWRNVIAADVVVQHLGSVSFKAEAQLRTAHALKVLAKLHPSYQRQVEQFIAQDPLRPHRMRLDLARLRRWSRERNTLLISHNRGGGTERHVAEQIEALRAEGQGTFELRPAGRPGHVALHHPEVHGLNNLAVLPLGDEDTLLALLREVRITALQLHHLIDFESEMHDVLLRIKRELRASLQLTVHDYYPLCPRVNLVGPDGRYCGEPDDAGCNACLRADGSIERTGPIVAWRRVHLGLMAQADVVMAPDEDVAQRFARYSAVPLQVVPHEPEPPPVPRQRPPRGADEPLKVLVIGAISRIKGFETVLALARAVQRQQLPLELSLLGFSCDDPPLRQAGVQVLGRYGDEELGQRIEALDPDIIFVPSIWPETYCYTLTAAMRSGCTVAAFDIGAQGRRLRQWPGPRLVLPLALSTQPLALAAALCPQTAAPAAARNSGKMLST